MYSKAGLIADCQNVFREWEILLAGLDEAQALEPGRLNDWSLKDIIAHLTAWQKITVARLDAGLHGSEPDFSEWPAEFDFMDELDVDHINAWIFDQYKDVPWPDISQEWKTRFQKVIELAEAVPETVLMETGKYPWLRHYPLGAVLVGTYNHHREHLDLLQDAFPQK